MTNDECRTNDEPRMKNSSVGFVRSFSSFSVVRHLAFGNRHCPLSVAFTHDEVQTAQHRRHVTYHATGQKLRQDTKVHKRWRANFQPIRHAASSAVDIKTKLALGIFGREIDFARWRIEPFGN